MPVEQVRARMLEHFADSPEAGQGQKWAELWDQGFVPWDRGRPNPALEDALKDRAELLHGAWTEGASPRRKRALVPGCGKGYDVLLLASAGYDAYGLDVSRTAVEGCKQFAREHAEDYSPWDKKRGAGKATFLLGDFFKDDWLAEIDGGSTFELLYDYTVGDVAPSLPLERPASCGRLDNGRLHHNRLAPVSNRLAHYLACPAPFMTKQCELLTPPQFLCALPPTLRPAWSLRYSQLLSTDPSSCLICLEFPTTKPASMKGPPFGVPSKVYVGHLTHPGEQLPYDEQDNLSENKIGAPSQQGLVRVAHWQPERTHEIGKGTDWVSMWKRSA